MHAVELLGRRTVADRSKAVHTLVHMTVEVQVLAVGKSMLKAVLQVLLDIDRQAVRTRS